MQVNPEFYRHDGEAWSHPSAWWAPSPWMLDQLPDARLVPVPVATDRFPMSIPTREAGVLRVLHTVGHKAAGDRNGTLQLFQALRAVRSKVTVRVTCQESRLPRAKSPSNVTVIGETGGHENYFRTPTRTPTCLGATPEVRGVVFARAGGDGIRVGGGDVGRVAQ